MGAPCQVARSREPPASPLPPPPSPQRASSCVTTNYAPLFYPHAPRVLGTPACPSSASTAVQRAAVLQPASRCARHAYVARTHGASAGDVPDDGRRLGAVQPKPVQLRKGLPQPARHLVRPLMGPCHLHHPPGALPPSAELPLCGRHRSQCTQRQPQDSRVEERQLLCGQVLPGWSMHAVVLLHARRGGTMPCASRAPNHRPAAPMAA